MVSTYLWGMRCKLQAAGLGHSLTTSSRKDLKSWSSGAEEIGVNYSFQRCFYEMKLECLKPGLPTLPGALADVVSEG